MTRNEIELIIRRPQVTNNCIGASAGAKRASYRPCILSAALVALFSVGAWSQTQLATVSGTITDPSGAVVPGVSVTIVSQGTGLKRSVSLTRPANTVLPACEPGTILFASRKQDSNRRFAKELTS